MMRTGIYWCLLSFLILASCKEVTDTSRETGSEIDCSKIAHGEFYLSDIAQDFSLLSLETTEESLIGLLKR